MEVLFKKKQIQGSMTNEGVLVAGGFRKKEIVHRKEGEGTEIREEHLRETRDELYETTHADAHGNKAQKLEAGVIDVVLEQLSQVWDVGKGLLKDAAGFVKEVFVGLKEMFLSVGGIKNALHEGAVFLKEVFTDIYKFGKEIGSALVGAVSGGLGTELLGARALEHVLEHHKEVQEKVRKRKQVPKEDAAKTKRTLEKKIRKAKERGVMKSA